MTEYLRNPLTGVWFALTAITIFSWWIGQGQGSAYQLDAAITVSVLVMAALKAVLVIAWFMEVRLGPAWLKRTTYGWASGLLVLLLLFYWLRV